MFEDIFKQLQNQSSETKKKMDSIRTEVESENGKLKIIADGNKQIKDIIISPELLSDVEQLQDLLLVTINRALEQAGKISTSEMQGLAKNLLPDLPDLNNIFGK